MKQKKWKHTLLKLLLVASLMGNAFYAGTLHATIKSQSYDTKGFAALADSMQPIDYLEAK